MIKTNLKIWLVFSFVNENKYKQAIDKSDCCIFCKHLNNVNSQTDKLINYATKNSKKNFVLTYNN